MDRVVTDFIALLRRSHVRVSPAEGIDGMLALRHVGLGDRASVRDALRATLIKRPEDEQTFDRLFDLFFSFGSAPAAAPARLAPHHHNHREGLAATELRFGEELEGVPSGDDGAHSHDDPDPIDLRKFLEEDQIQPSTDLHGDSESLRLSVFGSQLMLARKSDALQQALERVTHQLRVRRARSMSPGGIAPESGAEELAIDLTTSELDDLLDELRELGVDEQLVQAVSARAEDILALLPEIVEALLERQRRIDEARGDDRVTSRSLRKLLDFPPGEQRELEGAIRRLGSQLHGARTRRLKRDRSGRISVAHTLRRNMAYEGIPFEPVLRRRREQRPRLVVLCDVSLSTRNLARFWLQLVYQLQGLFSKVRTFVFVADLAEVTGLFEERTLPQAVEAIFGGRLVDVDENSDFGQAIEQFRAVHMGAVNRKTTVVVLGDGRNNGRPANERALEEVGRHARRMIWITPEPRFGWALGGCDMPRYEPYCDRVEVVRTVEELGRVAEELVADPARRSAA